MKFSGVWLFVGAALCGSGVEGRLRTVTRKNSPSPTPTPTPTGTPGCKVPAATRAIAASTPCASGVQAFALQVSDCNHPANGQFIKVRVAPVLAPPKDNPDMKEAHLWLDETCSVGDCGGDPLLTMAPTLFYLDGQKNLLVAPSSPLPANGTWLSGRRLTYSSNGDLPGAVIALLQFDPVDKPNKMNFPMACSTGSDGAFTCVPGQSTEPFPFGIQPDTDDEFSNGRGTTVAIADEISWNENCYGKGPACGKTTLKAVPACQSLSRRGMLDVLYT